MGFGLDVAAADFVVDLPVLVLAEGAAVAGNVAAAARLVGHTAAVPAHLFQQHPKSSAAISSTHLTIMHPNLRPSVGPHLTRKRWQIWTNF